MLFYFFFILASIKISFFNIHFLTLAQSDVCYKPIFISYCLNLSIYLKLYIVYFVEISTVDAKTVLINSSTEYLFHANLIYFMWENVEFISVYHHFESYIGSHTHTYTPRGKSAYKTWNAYLYNSSSYFWDRSVNAGFDRPDRLP